MCTVWYVITRASVDIAASADRVWEVFTDVERWPSWTASVRALEALDGPAIAVGHRFRIKQPRMPVLVWEVTEVDAPHAWTWAVRRPGATTYASHEVSPSGPSSCVVTQVIDQRGPIGVVVALLMRGMTKRYLELEGNGLKAASERAHPLASQS
jgi:uncharacterized protein YndB with AHSA1/START domain